MQAFLRPLLRALPLAIPLTVAAAVPLLGCSFETLEEHPCPKGGTKLTYRNFAKDFFATWCNRCHSADINERNGAPENFVFSDRAAIVSHKTRIFVRAAGDNSSMPPGPDDPPEAQRDDLADWLACGAPE